MKRGGQPVGATPLEPAMWCQALVGELRCRACGATSPALPLPWAWWEEHDPRGPGCGEGKFVVDGDPVLKLVVK